MATWEDYGSTEDGYGPSSYYNKLAYILYNGSSASSDQDTNGELHSHWFFDISDIPNGATVTQANLYLRKIYTSGDIAYVGNTADLYVGNGTAGSTGDTGDYNATVNNGVLFKSRAINGLGLGSDVNFLSTDSSAMTEIEDAVNDGNTLNFEMDIGWSGGIGSASYLGWASQNNATQAYRPYLTITYTPPEGGTPQRMMMGIGI